MAQTNTAFCPHCRGRIASDPRLAGQAVKCPHCQAAYQNQMPAPTAILVRWFVARDRQKQGPFTLSQLQQMAASVNLQPSDMLFEEGQSKWRPAREIEGLFPVAVPVDAAGDFGCKRDRLPGPARRHFSPVWVVLPAAGGASVGLLGGVGAAMYWQGTLLQSAVTIVLPTGLFGGGGGLLGYVLWLAARAAERRWSAGWLKTVGLTLAGIIGVWVLLLILGNIFFPVYTATEESALAQLKIGLESWKSGASRYELRQRKPPIDLFDPSYGLLGSELRRYEIKGLKDKDPVMRSYNFEVDLYVWYPEIREQHVHNRVFTVMRMPDGTWSISSVGG